MSRGYLGKSTANPMVDPVANTFHILEESNRTWPRGSIGSVEANQPGTSDLYQLPHHRSGITRQSSHQAPFRCSSWGLALRSKIGTKTVDWVWSTFHGRYAPLSGIEDQPDTPRESWIQRELFPKTYVSIAVFLRGSEYHFYMLDDSSW